MSNVPSRLLVVALLVSVSAHLVVLSLFWMPPLNKKAAGNGVAVEARLQAPKAYVGAPEEKSVGVVTPRLPPRQILVRSQVNLQAHAVMSEQAVLYTSSPVAAPPQGGGAIGAQAVAVPSAVPGNPNEVFGYRAALGGAIARLRARYEERYSDSERELRHGRSGRAEFVLRALNGTPPVLSLSKTSGHRVLDDQAQALFYQAIQVTSLPLGLRGRSFAIPLVMEFHLEEADQ